MGSCVGVLGEEDTVKDTEPDGDLYMVGMC